MSMGGKVLQFNLIVGSLLVLAGLCDFLAPGFLRMGAGFEIDATDKLVAGVLIMALGILHGMRWRKDW